MAAVVSPQTEIPYHQVSMGMPTEQDISNVAPPPMPEAQYKEAVVVGNGPSGIALSFFLAGHWPYYDAAGAVKNRDNIDEFLHCRLTADEDLSLVEQDLEFLSRGLEGRSTNPVALLFDALNHPDADLGLELPSMIKWQHVPEKAVDHVVLGRGPPGGAWQQMDGSVLTISLGCWMELPKMNFRQWEANQTVNSQSHADSRAAVSSVAKYYADYVQQQGLSDFFQDYTCVTSLRPIGEIPVGTDPSSHKIVLEHGPVAHCGLSKARGRLRTNSFHRKDAADPFLNPALSVEEPDALLTPPPSPPNGVVVAKRTRRRSSATEYPVTDPWDDIMMLGSAGDRDLLEWCWRERYCKNSSSLSTRPQKSSNTPEKTQLWEIRGYSTTHGRKKEFCYVTPNVVLATGNSDLPNELRVKGERLPFVLHSLRDLEKLISKGLLNSSSDPVAIVGAGLSAADAIIAARHHNIPVVHVFRRKVDDPNLIFKQLPPKMYPEYHKVHQMMSGEKCKGYQAMPQHVVIEIKPDHRIKVVGPWSCALSKVSYVLVCIGSRPNLSFLPAEGVDLGVDPNVPVNCRYNPIDIDVFTHQCTRIPGLYAMGPLVGENFVRFLQGGALAITNHLVRTHKKTPVPITIETRRLSQ